MCNCKNWCRNWSETHAGKYPKSEHSPGCEDYKTEKFSRVEHDGAACVMEQHDAAAMLAESEDEYMVETVILTRDQFERMGEFAGF